ncbi:LON peptidase N-terminal domain and RING finger protein 3-like [Chenopodium quinoa]|uniref:LON peptidase N-terminal domain and RING finger protein 3-like n=1 Tax=Chenopodium quinoa TaxID=63459 RepID=UPI000B797D65|nr:LON peptidase N-terminal domain and RING finger protein 3-like [Chenopodium quinoa]
MVTQDSTKTPKIKNTPSINSTQIPENCSNNMSMFSPRFKSVAAMAGWDEETLLSTLVVEDTPERNLRDKKRSDLLVKSPSTSSRKKRRRVRPGSIPIAVFNLDVDVDDESSNSNLKEAEKGKSDLPKKVEEKTKEKEQENAVSDAANCSSSSTLTCMDRLRDELSCAICLDICYEPSTTPCGHSFCKNCLKSAAEKCGKRCPKCRQLISNGRSCTINTVLWNTIQLLFPAEVESRIAAAAAAAANSKVSDQRRKSTERVISSSNQATDNSNPHLSRRLRVSRRSEEASLISSRGVPNQDEDAALALRLQREEFMDIYRSSSLARDNLRAMARRVMNR